MNKLVNKKFIVALSLFLLMNGCANAQEKTVLVKDAKAYGLYTKENYDQSIATYKKVIKAHPGYAPLYDGIGHAYLKKNQFDKAYQNFKVASKLDSKNSLYKIHAQEVVYLNTINTINKSKGLFGQAANFLPNNPKIERNIERVRDGRYQNFEFVVDLYPNYKDKDLTKGNMAFNKKNYEEAKSFYLNSIAKESKNFQAYNNLGLAFLAENKLTNAIEYFKKAINQNPKTAYPYNNLGVAYIKCNEYDGALKLFTQANSINKAYGSSLNNKAIVTIYGSLKNTNASIKYLETLSASNPDSMPIKQFLGLFYDLKGQWPKSINIYKSGLDTAIDNSRYIRKLGDMYFLDNKFPEAIACYRKAISINTEEPVTFVNIARAYEKINDPKSAFSNYQTAIRLNPNYTNTYRYFGRFLISQKRTDEAKGILRKYVELQPNAYDTPMIKNTLRRIYLKENS